MTVSPPPGVSDSSADPPLAVTSRCTMARPRPAPGGLVCYRGQPAKERAHRRLMPADELRERVPVVANDDARNELRIGDCWLVHSESIRRVVV